MIGRGDEKIHVCLLSLDSYPLFDDSVLNESVMGRVGGAELQMYYLATELARDDQFDVHVIVDHFGQERQVCREGVNLHRCSFRLSPVEPVQPITRKARLIKLLHQISADVYVHRSISSQTFYLSLYCRWANKSFLYMMNHDGGAIPELDPGRSSPFWFLSRRLFEVGLRSADHVIAQNDTQKKALQNNYGRSSSIRPSAHPMKEPEIPDGNPDFITWIARAKRWKQPERFLDLAESFPDESFLMIMPDAGDDGFRNHIKMRATSASHITFLDFVPPDEIDPYFRNSRIFVNTSNSEGFPNTFVQAARAATPILSYTVNPDGILETYDMGICADESISKLEDGLRFLLHDEASRRKMGQNARQYALQNHNLEQIIEEDKHLLRRLTAGTESCE